MLVEITIRIDGREVETVVGEVTGTPAERG
jgi:hypothetical protein